MPVAGGSLCLYFMDHETPIVEDQIPVGYAVEGLDIALIDNHGQPVPVGHVGEMVVRSRYLSPGYWRQPELTRTRFQSDPEEPTYRRYSTAVVITSGQAQQLQTDVMQQLLAEAEHGGAESL